ncbi:RNA polymerase sigma factor, partial [Armatimonas sp.]|uniref:RNA polymerase sigma factor n=1 Tax=Armatimonas sp. TaxID=1872638 RepID=UPI00286BC1AF
MATIGYTQERALESHRPRLVRLCARLASSGEWAEELAQETMIEAWRNWHKLERGEVSFAWLARIAQFVVRRWQRKQARHFKREQSLSELELELLSRDEPEVLEKREVLHLLDRALGRLPEQTRTILHRSYFQDQSLAEIAERDQITAANAAVRLWRGRAALQQVLKTHFREDALAYGLVSSEQSPWRQTTVWCANCGQRRLVAHQSAEEVVYRCPQCHPDSDPSTSLVFLRETRPDGPMPGDRVFLRRVSKHYAESILPALSTGALRCYHCHKPLPMQHYTPLSKYPTLRDRYGLYGMCESCQLYGFGVTLGRLYMA